MKYHTRSIYSAACALLIFAAANSSFAQTIVKETTTSTNLAGTISEFGTDQITIRSETSPDPVRYSYSKSTTYVDEAGAPVSIETVKSGLPVTVYYIKEGDRMVASKVIVRKAVVAVPAAPVAPAAQETTTKTTKTTTIIQK